MDYSNATSKGLLNDREKPALNRFWLVSVILGLVLFLVGFALGRALTMQQMAASTEADGPVVASVELPNAESMPARDVTGYDIGDLPRYPGSVRVEYRHVMLGELVETEVEYVVAAELSDVHDFYRRQFDEEEWVVADLGIYQGEWTFFIVSGEREAIVELEARQSLVEIEIELTEPPAP